MFGKQSSKKKYTHEIVSRDGKAIRYTRCIFRHEEIALAITVKRSGTDPHLFSSYIREGKKRRKIETKLSLEEIIARSEESIPLATALVLIALFGLTDLVANPIETITQTIVTAEGTPRDVFERHCRFVFL